MAEAQAAIGRHGAERLPSVIVNGYNIELKDEDGFLGDRASKAAFADMLDAWRKPLRKTGDDPFGEKSSESIGKSELDEILLGDDLAAAAVVHSAVEDFAQELSTVTGRFLKTKAWTGTECIVVGGGFRRSRIGELAIARADIILKSKGHKVDMVPIRFDPNEAGLIGGAHLAPSWIFEAHDSFLAVDIGGTNIRAGVVMPRLAKAADLSKASVWNSELWRHADDEPSREDVVKRLVKMLKGLIGEAEKEGLKLAPFIGLSCPGAIDPDGAIEKGAQNLPGNWTSSRFNLPTLLAEAIPQIAGHDTVVLMHNDGVVQGLSEVPFMRHYKRWGVLTIGTGLGNACFTNRNGKAARGSGGKTSSGKASNGKASGGKSGDDGDSKESRTGKAA